MKPGQQILLLRPDDLKSGPSEKWIKQFAGNLKLVSSRYASGMRDVSVLTPKSKDAGKLPENGGLTLIILHHSWLSDNAFMKQVEDTAAGSGDGNREVILVNTSSGIRDSLKGIRGKSRSFDFIRPATEEGEAELIDEGQPLYWSKLLDLVLDYIRSGRGGAGSIYLAQAETDMFSYRDVIRRELMEHGYSVVPDTDLLASPADLKSSIQKEAGASRLAVHLLGDRYGDEVSGESCSITELQVRYIGEYLESVEKDEKLSALTGLSRLVWIDPDFKPSDNRQADFVNGLQRNIEKLHRTEIVQTPLELFKTLIIKRLKKDDDLAAIPRDKGRAGQKQVYIIYQKPDEQKAGELAGRLSGKGISVARLDFAHKDLLKEHKRNLRDCDASVVFYENKNRAWLRSKVMDLLKAPGYGRTKPLELRLLLSTGSDTLEDFGIPGGIILERETDPGKASVRLLEHLK